MRIGLKDLEKYKHVCVIAEVASSHERNKRKAIDLLERSAEAGADAVKFQIFSARKLLVVGHHKFRDFQQIEMTPDEWREVHTASVKANIPFVAEIFDEESLSLMLEIDVAAFKIHSTDLTNPHLLKGVAKSGKPLLLSCGGSTPEEIAFATETIRSEGSQEIVLLHGFQSFPTKLEDTKLFEMQRVSERFGYPVGYADHCDAESPFSILLPMVAIGMGACVIEKHITLDRSLRGRDYYSALNPGEFRLFVSRIREVESVFGCNQDGLSEAEVTYRRLMKKSIVAARRIRRGEEIALSDLGFKRSPSPGLQPREYGLLIGKRAKRDIDPDSLLSPEDVQ